jgi:hypothetical protein
LRRHVKPAEPRLATIEKVGCTCAWTTTVVLCPSSRRGSGLSFSSCVERGVQ